MWNGWRDNGWWYNKAGLFFNFAPMKRSIALILLILGVILSFQTGIAFAVADVYGYSSSQISAPVRLLLSFNRWLYANNFQGVNFINDNVAAAQKLAFGWDPHAQLYEVDVQYDGQKGTCSIEFGSEFKPTQIFSADCVDLKIDQPKSRLKSPGHVFQRQDLMDFPVLKLRKFVSDILGSSEMLKSVSERYQVVSSSGKVLDPSIDFTLSADNSDHEAKWSFIGNSGFDVSALANTLTSQLYFDTFSY